MVMVDVSVTGFLLIIAIALVVFFLLLYFRIINFRKTTTEISPGPFDSWICRLADGSKVKIEKITYKNGKVFFKTNLTKSSVPMRKHIDYYYTTGFPHKGVTEIQSALSRDGVTMAIKINEFLSMTIDNMLKEIQEEIVMPEEKFAEIVNNVIYQRIKRKANSADEENIRKGMISAQRRISDVTDQKYVDTQFRVKLEEARAKRLKKKAKKEQLPEEKEEYGR